MAATPALHTMPDRALRDSLRHPEHLRSLLRQAAPALAESFDYARMKPIERAFALDDWRGREADLLFEVPFRTNVDRAALVCVLIEHQSDPDPLMSLRMLLDAALYWERQWRDHQQASPPRSPLRLCPVLPIVFYTGGKGWRSFKTLRDLLDEPAAFHYLTPDWRPIFWNLNDSTPQQLIDAGEDWLLALAVIRAADADTGTFERVYEQALRQLNQMSPEDEVRWYDLVRMTLTWGYQRRPTSERPRLAELAARTIQKPQRKQKVMSMTQTIAESLIAEGEAKGKVEGKVEGKREGALESLRQTLLVMGRQRLGKPGRRQQTTLAAISDGERLARMRDAFLSVQSWQELLAIT